MTTIFAALLGLMLPLAAPGSGGADGRTPQAEALERDNANNNSVNRRLAQPPSEDTQFARVPGGTATPPKDWKTGDKRGQPPEARRKRKHRKQKTPRRTP
jgi:hypothetical protein